MRLPDRNATRCFTSFSLVDCTPVLTVSVVDLPHSVNSNARLLLLAVSVVRNESWQIGRLFQALCNIAGADGRFPLPREALIRLEIKIDRNHPRQRVQCFMNQ